MKFRIRSMHCILAIGSNLLACASVQAQAGEPNVDRQVEVAISKARRLYADEAFVSKYVAERTPLKGEHAKVMERHLRSVLTNENVLTRIGEVMRPALESGLKADQAASYMLEAGMGLQMKGFTRLSNEDIEDFLSFSASMMDWMPPEICRKAIRSEITTRQSQIAEHMFLQTRSIAEMEQVMSIYRRALLAEVNDYPSRRTVNAEQASLAQTALGTAVQRRFSRMEDPRMSMRVMADEARANAKELCTVNTTAIRAALDLKDPIRSWALVNFAHDMSR